MPNTVSIDASNHILITYQGDQTVETAKSLHRKVLTAVDDLHRRNVPAYILVDVTDLGTHDSGSHMATIDSLRNLHFEKMAVIGANPYMKHIGNFILQAAGKFDLIQYVQNQKEAEQWFAQEIGKIYRQQVTKKILVIDSDLMAQEMYRATFEPLGYETLCVPTVASAQTILSVENPDLVVLDLTLSGGENGFDFLEQLKKDTKKFAIPVMVITNLAGQEQMAKELGADGYLIKRESTPENILKQAQSLFRAPAVTA